MNIYLQLAIATLPNKVNVITCVCMLASSGEYYIYQHVSVYNRSRQWGGGGGISLSAINIDH